MASIVTDILSKSVGLLLNKARDMTADKLKDGDVTDRKIREIIVRELNDVKTKLDGQSRSHLLTSYNFLLEGVNLVKASLDKSEGKQKAVVDETHGDGGETSTKPNDAAPGILNEALTLSQAMGRVKIKSDKDFESAKKRFKDARKKATEAFWNEALSTKDRIFAAKLRIVSELLECLEILETAITNCLPFLKNLHSLPAIREIFSVYINGGLRSMVSKAERVENVKSVMLINYVLFQFVSEFSSKYCSAITWPTIELADRSFSPVLGWQEVSTRRSWGEEFIQPPNEVILDEEINHAFSAVNSHGEIIVSAMDEKNIYAISKTGQVKMVKLNYPGNGEVIERYITGLAVDSSNNIYVVVNVEMRTESGVVTSYVLYVFDEYYNAKQNCTLQFLDPTFSFGLDIAINNNNNIIMILDEDPTVYVCDNNAQLKHKFILGAFNALTLPTSDKNEILLVSRDCKAVHRYTEKGDLASTIVLPEGHKIRNVAFHHGICKTVVLTHSQKSDSYFLLCYSETGEQENSSFLSKKGKGKLPLIMRSHPGGPAVVLWRESITFI